MMTAMIDAIHQARSRCRRNERGMAWAVECHDGDWVVYDNPPTITHKNCCRFEKAGMGQINEYWQGRKPS